MGADDDGALSYAIAVDKRHQTIIIRYGKGLFELRGITA